MCKSSWPGCRPPLRVPSCGSAVWFSTPPTGPPSQAGEKTLDLSRHALRQRPDLPHSCPLLICFPLLHALRSSPELTPSKQRGRLRSVIPPAMSDEAERARLHSALRQRVGVQSAPVLYQLWNLGQVMNLVSVFSSVKWT